MLSIDSGDSFNINQPLYPLRSNQTLNRFSALDGDNNTIYTFVIRQYDSEITNLGFASLGTAEPEFIKRWRGVARTSVVDLAEEATIEVPPFDANDFYYIDQSTGVKTNLTNATQRIDLLFIYAKPVDASSTTIAKYISNTQPTTITTPALGIVQGAGVGVDFRSSTRASKRLENGVVTNGSNQGSLKILAHIGDEAGSNTGFKVSGISVRGSFPSPDDLMNLTPMLDEQLTTNHLALIGQSILPIAYIVVKKNAGINANDVNIITPNDIIDIRPFFRTTELSYNERAGLAAAVPAPSLANPVVTQAELKYEINRAIDSIRTTNPPPPPTSTPPPSTSTNSRVLGMGYIFGGLKYGPEGVFANSIASQNEGKSINDIMPLVRTDCGLPSSIEIPILPQWDVAEWLKNSTASLQEVGSKINDRLNVFCSYWRKLWDHHDGYDGDGGSNFAAIKHWSRTNRVQEYITSNKYPYKFNTTRNSTGDWQDGQGWTEPLTNPPRVREYNAGAVSFFWFVRKKYYITLPSDIHDYDVNAKLLNCLSHTTPAFDGNSSFNHAPNSADCIWIEKGSDQTGRYFAINVAFPAKPVGEVDQSKTDSNIVEWHNDWNGYSYGFTQYAINGVNSQIEIEADQFGVDTYNSANNETTYKDNCIYSVQRRKGIRPNSMRDYGEITALWLATNQKVMGTPYYNRENRGMVAMGICNYPSVMFTITGFRQSGTINGESSNSTPIITFS
jgi:hypothetical protein